MRFLYLLTSVCVIITMAAFTNNSGLTVTSSAFSANGMIPAKYSCEGAQASPPLHISNIPSGAKSLALILHDPDAPMKGGFTHWVMWNIDVNGDIPENFKGAMTGLNGAQQNSYFGMCPPSGTHHYHFRVYALDTKLDLPNATNKTGLERAMKGHIMAEADLVGLYKKTK